MHTQRAQTTPRAARTHAHPQRLTRAISQTGCEDRGRATSKHGAGAEYPRCAATSKHGAGAGPPCPTTSGRASIGEPSPTGQTGCFALPRRAGRWCCSLLQDSSEVLVLPRCADVSRLSGVMRSPSYVLLFAAAAKQLLQCCQASWPRAREFHVASSCARRPPVRGILLCALPPARGILLCAASSCAQHLPVRVVFRAASSCARHPPVRAASACPATPGARAFTLLCALSGVVRPPSCVLLFAAAL